MQVHSAFQKLPGATKNRLLYWTMKQDKYIAEGMNLRFCYLRKKIKLIFNLQNTARSFYNIQVILGYPTLKYVYHSLDFTFSSAFPVTEFSCQCIEQNLLYHMQNTKIHLFLFD